METFKEQREGISERKKLMSLYKNMRDLPIGEEISEEGLST